MTRFNPNFGPTNRPYFASTTRRSRPRGTPTAVTPSPTSTASHHSLPRLTTTSVPTLPPPGGDVPPYMKYGFNKFGSQQEDTTTVNKFKFTFDGEEVFPSMVKKVPIVRPPAISPTTTTNPNPMNPFSGFMSPLTNILMPKWFQQQQDDNQQTPKRRVDSASSAPVLPPPSNFPSYEQAKRKKTPTGNPGAAKPKRAKPTAGSVMVPVDNYADFFQKQIRDQFMSTQRKNNNNPRPPLQFSPVDRKGSRLPPSRLLKVFPSFSKSYVNI